MYCRHCGNQLSDTAKVCEKCGKNVEIKTEEKTVVSTAEGPIYAPAGIWRRVSNFLLDKIFKVAFSFFVGLFIGLLFLIMGTDASSISMLGWTIIGILSYFLYYLLFEGMWQRTVAKFITGTKVVMRDGSKPPFKNIFGRTLARLIPFEPLSFLFSPFPIGWHDMLSKTIVVPSNYTEDDVKKIDYDKIKKIGGSNTAAIVVVVIICFFIFTAILGILASVVLVSLQSARQKSQDSKIEYVISQMRVNAEMYYADNGDSYSQAQNCNSGLFKEQNMQQIMLEIPKTEIKCYAEKSSYAISADMATPNKSYCVDSSGYKGDGVAIDDGTHATCKFSTLPPVTDSD